jgi:uncharacterized protein (DUF1697 family)
MNARMPDIKRCFEAAGWSNVRTLLSSGNVVFDARSSSPAALERRAERAMTEGVGRSFDTFVRTAAYLQALIAPDPYAAFDLPPAAKRVVTFLRVPTELHLDLPIERDGAGIVACNGSEVFSAYLPGPKGPVFMNLLERSFGTAITTRTLDTVRKCASA